MLHLKNKIYGDYKIGYAKRKDKSRHIIWDCVCQTCGEHKEFTTYKLKKNPICKHCHGNNVKINSNSCITPPACVIPPVSKNDPVFFPKDIGTVNSLDMDKNRDKDIQSQDYTFDLSFMDSVETEDFFQAEQDVRDYLKQWDTTDDDLIIYPETYKEFYDKYKDKLNGHGTKILDCDIVNNLLNAPIYYHIAHCVDANLTFAKGTASIINAFYNMRVKIFKEYTPNRIRVGEALLVDNVFNLLANQNRYDKVTMDSLYHCVVEMAEICKALNIKYLAMPHIGCGYNKLQWEDVKEMIDLVFFVVLDEGEFINIRYYDNASS